MVVIKQHIPLVDEPESQYRVLCVRHIYHLGPLDADGVASADGHRSPEE